MTTLSTRSHCITAATAVELSIRDSTILMLWTAQARAQPSPRHNCHHHYITLPYTTLSTFTSFSCLSAASRRLGSIVPRRASTKDSGSIAKTLFGLGFEYFRGLSIPTHCAHGRTALRLPGAKGSSEWSTRIDQRQICATRTSGCNKCNMVAVVLGICCWRVNSQFFSQVLDYLAKIVRGALRFKEL